MEASLSEVLCHPQSGLKPIRNIDLFEDIVEVSLDGVCRDEQLLRNFLVLKPAAQEHKDLDLP